MTAQHERNAIYAFSLFVPKKKKETPHSHTFPETKRDRSNAALKIPYVLQAE